MKKMNSMGDLVENMLVDIYAAEQQAMEIMPQMAANIDSDKLRSMLEDHEEHTLEQCQRLEQILDLMEVKIPKSRKHPVIAALGKEFPQMIRAGGDPQVLDAAIILAAQKIEHIEIASYGTAIAMAKQLGENRIAKILAENLKEEKRTDQQLTQLAQSSVNPKASSTKHGGTASRTSRGTARGGRTRSRSRR
jgi:ferritin-like metal-binding protein YciE